jgi:xylose isomerase
MNIMVDKVFSHIQPIQFEGKNSVNPLAYRYYNPTQVILNKTMEEHLRLAVCCWNAFSGIDDIAYSQTTETPPIKLAEIRTKIAFEFVEKLGLRYFTFHDRDIAPECDTLQKTQQHFNAIADIIAREMEKTNLKLLWGSADLFSHRRYLAGAATNPSPDVFSYAVAQVKQAIDITHYLQGENYVLWGGREGYDTLLNTNLSQELEQLARFLTMLVDYKYKIGFKGALLIEPKPYEPTKHQYDYNSATVFAFLQKHNLEKEFKINIAANYATLAGHTFPHEVAYAYANDIFGSIDANHGDPQLGWATDQFPTHLSEIVQVLYLILQNGGFATGGFNFEIHLRQQGPALMEIFHRYISGIDTLAHGLLVAANLIAAGDLEKFIQDRYQNWQSALGQAILRGQTDFEKIVTQLQNKTQSEIII